MHAAEVVVRKMQIHSSPKIFQFSGKSVRQPRESAKLHSDGQVLPFNVAGRNVVGIGITASDLGYNLRDLSWGVAFISLLAVISVELRKLSEIRIAAERFLDCLAIEDVGIGGQLHTMVSDSAPNVGHEGLRVFARPLADQERRNQFSVSVQSDENPLVAELCRIALADVARLLHQEGPDFIALETATRQFAHFLVHQFLAAFASHDQKAHDRVPVQACQSFRGSDRAALKQALQRPCSGIRGGAHASKRRSGLRFAKGGTTGIAAPALNAALTKVTEPLAGLVLASNAGHIGLVFLAGQADNVFEVGIAAYPRVD